MNRELDMQCGRALGWSIDFTGGILRAYRPDGALAYLPFYSNDATMARLLEDDIERRGLQNDYEQALIGITGAMYYDYGNLDIWPLIRATPEQRAHAYLKARGL